MSRLIIIIGLLFCAWLAVRWFIRTPPHDVVRGLKKGALGLVLLVIIALALSGRLHWLAAVGAALVPLLRRGWVLLRYLPFLRGLYARYQAGQSQRPPLSGQRSTVDTVFLHMTLDHDSGDMDGEVVDGPYADRFLSQMAMTELRDLLTQCQTASDDSAALLEAYLDRHHSDWRATDEADQQQRATASHDDAMNQEEACAILGVDEDADEAAIVLAHRRLMHKLHPDRGGSNYLAAKINLAKDFLLNKA